MHRLRCQTNDDIRFKKDRVDRKWTNVAAATNG